MTQNWVKLLFAYGPFALLVLFVFILEQRVRSRVRGPKASRMDRGLYLAVWSGIFLLAIVATVVWVKLNLNEEAVIRGRLLGLLPSDKIQTPFQDMFIRGAYTGQQRNDYFWRIFSPHKLEDGTAVQLYIDTGPPPKENITIFELPIAAEFYSQSEVQLHFDRQQRRLLLRSPSGYKALKIVDPQEVVTSAPRTLPFLSIPKVLAQEDVDFSEMSARLQSDDPVTRVYARRELSELQAGAFPFAQHVLTNESSYYNYRLRLGVITALNGISSRVPISLDSAAICEIALSAADSDLTLRSQAEQLLSRHREVSLKACAAAPQCTRQHVEEHGFSSLDSAGLLLYVGNVTMREEAEIYLLPLEKKKALMQRSGFNGKELKSQIKKLKNETAAPLLDADGYVRKMLARGAAMKVVRSYSRTPTSLILSETHHHGKDNVLLTICGK